MRPPDLTIGPRANPQTRRWHLLRWRGLQISLHEWLRSDDDRALHDHSGHSISVLLTGRYRDLVRTREWYQDDPVYLAPPGADVISRQWTHYGDGEYYRDHDIWHTRYPLVPYWRNATTPHRVALISDRKVWSIWVRFPPFREWGFHCPRGWLHWKDYTNTRDYSKPGSVSEIGPGCG